MRYQMHMMLRKIYMGVLRKDCCTCKHFDGRFGEDCCFRCEHSIRAVEYDRK